jgi:penicillin-binding protein 2
LIVGIRLIVVQIFQGSDLRAESDNNRIISRLVPANRGVITDRNKQPLVINQPIYKLLTDENGRMLVDKQIIAREEYLKMETEGDDRVVFDIGRFYPYGPVFAHILGYVGEANEKEVDGEIIKAGDLVGKNGLEKQFDETLRGAAGNELIEINAKGRVQRRINQRAAVAGLDLELGLDAGLQQEVSKLMQGKTGAVVVTVPATGEVLALFSSPSFDPNLFSGKAMDVDEVVRKDEPAAIESELSQILTDPDKPLMNRATSGAYPPGSTFKIVPAVAGMETGEVKKDTLVNDTGEIRVDKYSYKNWYFTQYGRVEGEVDLQKALQRSNDIFFYKVGEWLGAARLGDWAGIFGYGKKTGIELPSEVSGLVPTPLWKERIKGEKWFLGNTYHMAIGQGDVLATPIQVNEMMGVVANGGRWCKPRLVTKIGGQETGVECKELGINLDNLNWIKTGLEKACASGGTAYPFFDFDLSKYGPKYQEEGHNRVACKTGTAQFNVAKEYTHAWFTVFAPKLEPEILVTILIEGGGEGSKEAAPIARKILEYWFEKKNSK